MEDKKAEPNKPIRPTKKQLEMLRFIEEFIVAQGYSPSYREIMKGLQYTSVATVALHVNNLIKRGHLQKRDRSARSLEVVKPTIIEEPKITPKQLKTTEEKWLVEKIETFVKEAEASPRVDQQQLDKLHVLVAALKILGSDGASQAFGARIAKLKKPSTKDEYIT
jgi:repressor LexA